MNPISLLIKPTSGLCNLKCEYCFYFDVMDNRDCESFGMMSNNTLEKMIRRVFEVPRLSVDLMFQGGEPTMIGLDYYELLVELVQKYNHENCPVNYTIQTNGILIDELFAKFFKKHNFLVGISIDGIKEVNDTFRLDQLGKGTYDRVLNGLNNLKKYDVDFNILSVVTNKTVHHTEEIYNELKNIGTDYLQFIPCIDSFDKSEGSYTLSSDNYLEFLKRLFDAWYEDILINRRVSIRYFDDILAVLLGYPPSSCTMYGYCVKHVVIESNGNIYPCDFYVLDEWLLGNVYDNSFHEILNNPIANDFVSNSINNFIKCNECKYYRICRGGCKRNKEPFIKVEDKLTKFCDSYYNFFDYSIDRFIKIAEMLKNEKK